MHFWSQSDNQPKIIKMNLSSTEKWKKNRREMSVFGDIGSSAAVSLLFHIVNTYELWLT